ncbi:MAG TPA: HD domain-containing protein [Dehalococcoidales bacterium]|nr:HD domain-containing protein [Dehalococcoidales bacterium]
METEKLSVNPGAFQLIDKIRRLLAGEKSPSYLVGGFVRDLLVARDNADIDIAVGEDAQKVAQKVAAALDGKYVPLDEENGVARVVIPGQDWHIDFSSYRDSIGDDLARRDFTFNAMALPLDEGFSSSVAISRLIDPFGGLGDLRHRVLRIVNPGVFATDPVRLLRAIRISAELGLMIERLTETPLRQSSRLISGVAGERVREELLRILALPGAGNRIAFMDELGLLTAVIPELEHSRGVTQPVLHVWDVFTHSVKMVSSVEFLLRQGAWEYAPPDALESVPWSEKLAAHFNEEIGYGSTRASLLKLAALLHDIAKPEMKTTDETGRTRFLGHPEAGAATAAAIMSRLRFSNREVEYVELLVKEHMRPTQMSQDDTPTRRAVYRFFRDTGESGVDLLFLSLADHLAARGDTLDTTGWLEHAKMVADIIARREEEDRAPKPLKLIDGNEIISTFRLEPGPRIGEILETVREAQAAGEICDKEQAIKFIERWIGAH